MSLSFTAFEFFDVFRKYNEDIWPLQFLLLAAGAAAALLPASRRPGTDRAIATILTFLWGWMALVYHLMFFIEINPAALCWRAPRSSPTAF